MKDNNKKSNKGLIIGLSVGIPMVILIIGNLLFFNCTCTGYEIKQSNKAVKNFIKKYDIKDSKNIKILSSNNIAILSRPTTRINYNNKEITIIDYNRDSEFYDDYESDKILNSLLNYFKNKFNYVERIETAYSYYKEKYNAKNTQDFLIKEKPRLTFYIKANSGEEAKKIFKTNAYKIVDYMEKLNSLTEDKELSYKIEFHKNINETEPDLFCFNIDYGGNVKIDYVIDEQIKLDVEDEMKTDRINVSCQREKLVHGMCKDKEL